MGIMGFVILEVRRRMTVSDETARRAPWRRERAAKTTNLQPLESTYALYPCFHCQGREVRQRLWNRDRTGSLTGGRVPSQPCPASVSGVASAASCPR